MIYSLARQRLIYLEDSI